MFQILCCTVLVLLYVANAQTRLAGECASLCNDLRTEVLTMEICKDAKRTLPRPKVGDFCSNAMEQGFSDACVAMCMDEKPVPRVAQTCRAAAIEMPRPTVRKWCEHGYNTAFTKTVKDLKSHFRPDAVATPFTPEKVLEAQPDVVREAAAAVMDHHDALAAARQADAAAKVVVPKETGPVTPVQSGSGLRGGNRSVKATLPITIGDSTKDLVVYDGQNAEDAVVVFCRDNVPEDVSSCIRQLLPTVLAKLEEAGAGI